MNNEDKKKPEIIHRINDNIMKFNYSPQLETIPKVHIGLNPFYHQMRQEVHNLQNMHLKLRQKKMLELFIQDHLRDEEELSEVGFDYINTQP